MHYGGGTATDLYSCIWCLESGECRQVCGILTQVQTETAHAHAHAHVKYMCMCMCMWQETNNNTRAKSPSPTERYRATGLAKFHVCGGSGKEIL
eukprot:scaffold100022_cov60-Phaeocystis_antarctica.AAC.2